MEFGVQRRCWLDAIKKVSIQQWALGLLRLSIKRTRKTLRDGHNSGVKILQFMFSLQLPLTCKPWTTLSNPCNKVRGIYFYKEVFLHASVVHCVGMYPACICIWEYNTTYKKRFLTFILSANFSVNLTKCCIAIIQLYKYTDI